MGILFGALYSGGSREKDLGGRNGALGWLVFQVKEGRKEGSFFLSSSSSSSSCLERESSVIEESSS